MSSSQPPPTEEQGGRPPTPPPSFHVQQSPSASVLPSLLTTPTLGAQRRVAIAVDLSEESAYAVRWSIQNYLRPGDAVVLLHVRPTNVLYGADWGSVHGTRSQREENRSAEQIESDYCDLTSSKAGDLARPLVEAQVPYKIHIVKDHDMKERLCLEVERLGLSAMIMGSRGFGATTRSRRANRLGRLGSVSDYCVHHCICPVVVVRYPEDNEGGGSEGGIENGGDQNELHPVPEDDQEYHDASGSESDEFQDA